MKSTKILSLCIGCLMVGVAVGWLMHSNYVPESTDQGFSKRSVLIDAAKIDAAVLDLRTAIITSTNIAPDDAKLLIKATEPIGAISSSMAMRCGAKTVEGIHE